MTLRRLAFAGRPTRAAAFTLVEVLVAAGLSGLLVTVLGFLTIYGARSFQALGNYSELDAQSRNALDVISQQMRQSTALVAFQTNSSNMSVTLTNANQGTSMKLNWSPDSHQLTCSLNGASPPTVLLSQCDSWSYTLYNRAPNVTSTNITFYLATNGSGVLDATRCKLMNMTWKCSRTILGSKINTESVQTAQIVFRNKIN